MQSSLPPPPKLNIFHIPEIQHGIFGRRPQIYSQRELVVLMLVSKEWHQILQPIFWQRLIVRIFKVDVDGEVLKLDDNILPSQQSILDNHIHLQEFETDSAQVLKWVAESKRGQRLRSLKYWNLTSDTNANEVNNYIVELLKLNPGITALGLGGIMWIQTPTFNSTDILLHTANLNNLQELELRGFDLFRSELMELTKDLVKRNASHLWSFKLEGCDIHNDFFKDLGRLENLAVFGLARNFGYDPVQVYPILNSISKNNASDMITSSPSHGIGQSVGLIDLGIEVPEDAQESPFIHGPFLVKHSNLIRLQLTGTRCWYLDLVLKSIVCPLTHLTVDNQRFTGFGLSSLMHSQHCSSLTYLAFNFDTRVTSQSIQTMLVGCINLETFKVQCGRQSREEGNCFLDSQDMINLDWGCCQSLKYLSIAISVKGFEVNKGNNNSLMKLDKQPARSSLDIYFQQLSKLPFLEKLETKVIEKSVYGQAYRHDRRRWLPLMDSWKSFRRTSCPRIWALEISIWELVADLSVEMQSLVQEEWPMVKVSVWT